MNLLGIPWRSLAFVAVFSASQHCSLKLTLAESPPSQGDLSTPADAETSNEDEPSNAQTSYGTTGKLGPVTGVTAPAGAVIVNPSTPDLAAIIADVPAGGAVFFEAGTYRDLAIAPKDHQTYVGEHGAVLTSDNKASAFRSEAASVTIRNLVIDGYTAKFPFGAIVAGGKVGWTIDHVEVKHAAAAGVVIYDRSHLKNSFIHHNGELGVKAVGKKVSVSNCELAHNNINNQADVFFESGGTKFFETTDAVFTHNNVHDNIGNGIWFDYRNAHGTISNNWSHGNTLAGIYWEVSHAGTIVKNLCENNGRNTRRDPLDHHWLQGAGIRIEASENVSVLNNVLKNNAQGIALVVSDRDDALPIRGISIKKNVVSMTTGRTGVVWEGKLPATGTVVFRANNYDLSGKAGFTWSNPNTGFQILTLKQWQAAGNQ